MPSDQLLALGYGAPRSKVVVRGQTYDIDVWSEPIQHEAQGLCVVIARLIARQAIGSTHYVQGFVLLENGGHADMAERELWQYD